MFNKYIYGLLFIYIFYLTIQNYTLEFSLNNEKIEKQQYKALYEKSQKTIKQLNVLAKRSMQRETIIYQQKKERDAILNNTKVQPSLPQGIIDEKTRYLVITRLNRPL